MTFRHREHGPADTQLIRVPLLNMPRFVDDPELAGHIVGLDTYYDDVRNGTLPAVSYIVSLGSSEQPPSDPAAGQRLVKGLLDTLLKSDAWASAAFLLTYDDSGGWYDHVPPPNVDDRGYGFRVPSLLISPYVRRGYVEHTVLDFTSILRFIEDNYGLQPLTTRDATAQSLEVAFNFSQTPRAPAITSLQPPTPALTGPRRLALELSYSAALVGATVIIAWAAVGPRLQRRRATAARKQREGES